MTQHKDLKKLVRIRMSKTGEAYTAARAVLLAKKGRGETPGGSAVAASPQALAAPHDYATLAGMSDDAVAAKTGCNWAKWVRSLDAHGMAARPHREIAEFVHEKYKIPGWWAQTVTVGYERIKGLREIGQRRGGSYEAAKSKTVPVPLAVLYRAWRDERKRASWLGAVELTVRKATAERSLRITWEDGTSVELWFTAKGEAKSSVAVQHVGLPTKADAEARKLYWAGRLAALATFLTGAAAVKRSRGAAAASEEIA
jgi:hypothetical protein